MATMKADLPVLELEGVAKRYGAVQAVRDVTFSLPQGARVALVGHNGAGKTTLMKLMLGLIRPSAGRLRVLGEDPAAGVAGARQRLGWLPENVSFNPSLTGREILRFFARLKGERTTLADELLERVGLPEAARRRVGGYSKGMRQRLGLAQAMLGSPRALLLDEPASGLDPALRRSFYAILHELRDEGAAILLSSHALTELEGEVDRVIVMNSGHKLADGEIQALRDLSGLRPRLRVRLPAPVTGTNDWQQWRALPGGLMEVECDEPEILPLL